MKIMFHKIPFSKEWGSSCPHEYVGSYRLEADMSWTPVSKLDKKDKELNVINQILSGTKTLSAAIEFSGEPAELPRPAITIE